VLDISRGGVVQACIDRTGREAGPVFLAIQPFLLERTNEYTIGQKGRGRVAVKGVDAENIHLLIP
jgi:hypothetical protein